MRERLRTIVLAATLTIGTQGCDWPLNISLPVEQQPTPKNLYMDLPQQKEDIEEFKHKKALENVERGLQWMENQSKELQVAAKTIKEDLHLSIILYPGAVGIEGVPMWFTNPPSRESFGNFTLAVDPEAAKKSSDQATGIYLYGSLQHWLLFYEAVFRLDGKRIPVDRQQQLIWFKTAAEAWKKTIEEVVVENPKSGRLKEYINLDELDNPIYNLLHQYDSCQQQQIENSDQCWTQSFEKLLNQPKQIIEAL